MKNAIKQFSLFAAICTILFGTSVSAFAQNVVKGTVTDAETGEPLIGVSVAIEGTSKGVITDIDGAYSIEAESNQILVFGYLGYKTASSKVDGNVINVKLTSDINTLDAVVMLGYSSVKKAELSSSAVTVQGEELHDVVTSDLGNMLQGKVAGVSVYNTSGAPGSGATIRIRGTGSISASSSPLYVVDGVVGGTFSPNDVESITVLKDAGATAIYGASGAGGVIVVTTKQAKRGQESVVNFKANVGAKQALTGRFHPMDAYELASYLKSINKNYYVPSDLDAHNFDWWKEATQVGVVQDYYVSASGSQGKMTYLASVDYYDELGTAKASDFNNVAARINVGAEIAKNLQMNVKANYTVNRAHNQSVLGAAYNELPFDSPIDCNTGEYICITSSKRPDNGESWLGHDKNNPFWSQKVNDGGWGGSSFQIDAQLIWTINDDFSLTATGRYGDSFSDSFSITSPEAKSGTYPDGYKEASNSWGKSYSTTTVLKYAHTFNQDHTVSALLGHEWGYSWGEWNTLGATGIANGISAFSSMVPFKVAGSFSETEAWSAFAQATYSYKEKYFLNATFRADASSVFAPNNKVGYFPSVSAAWLASAEDFMKDQDVVSFLKIRSSFGTTGNSGLSPYSYLDVYEMPAYLQYQSVAGAMPATVANPDLHWETAVMANLGIDVSFGNYLTVNLDLYNNENKDLLLEVPLSPATGFDVRTENTGRVRNRGIEIELNSNNIMTKDFKWSTGFNIGFNKNTVVYLPNHEDIIPSTYALNQIYREGEDLYTWYGVKWLGVDPANGDPLWEHLIKDENGNVIGKEPTNTLDLTNDVQILGSAQPKFIGGLSNTFTYKGFTLDCNFQFIYGNQVFNWTRRVMDSDGAYNDYNAMSLDNGLGWSRWEKEGDIATHPKPRSGGNRNANEATSRYLEDGSYLRLKNVSLSYDLPKQLLKKINLKEGRVTLSGDNLLTFTRFSGSDPEIDLSGGLGTAAGLYSYNYPVGRLVSLGVSVKF